MPFVKIPQESFEIALVLGRCFVVGLFELGVANIGFAVFAPVFRLDKDGQCTYTLGGFDMSIPLTSSTPTLQALLCGQDPED